MALSFLEAEVEDFGVLLFSLDSSGFGRSCLCTVLRDVSCGATEKQKLCCPYGTDVPEALACIFASFGSALEAGFLLFRSTSFVLCQTRIGFGL